MPDDAMLLSELLDTYDYVWGRLLRRVEGLGDAEYLWEPVVGCLSVRRLDGGITYCEPGVWPELEPSPVTTIAWRICHIGANFLEPRMGPLFGGPPSSGAVRMFGRPPFDGPCWAPMSAREGIAYMTGAYEEWRGHLASVSDVDLAAPLTQGTTPYEGKPLTRFVLQYLEELAHHAAEVALLRDLYRDRFRSDDV